MTKGVLVIEDEPEIRDALADVLESEGYPVTAAANGREGLERLGRMDPPGLILLDLMMPVMGGGEFLHVLRADPSRSEQPVVIVSAWPEEAEQLSSETQGYVPKPIPLEELLVLVERYCGPPPRA